MYGLRLHRAFRFPETSHPDNYDDSDKRSCNRTNR